MTLKRARIQMAVVAPPVELATVAERWQQEASVLNHRGDDRAARLLTQVADEVLSAASEYTEWLDLAAAMRRADWSGDQVRRHARKFVHTPHVRITKKEYWLRACIVPRSTPYEMLHTERYRR